MGTMTASLLSFEDMLTKALHGTHDADKHIVLLCKLQKWFKDFAVGEIPQQPAGSLERTRLLIVHHETDGE